MKKIIMIIAYFGKLPNYFKLWLKSVEMNPTVNFLLATDDKTDYKYPDNVKVIYTTFEKVKETAEKCFEFPINLKSPYKLCEYKPFYNKIFSKEVKGYDFWGFCDIDLIFGNIRNFVTEEILENYAKIYTKGHMTLFKNTEDINKTIMYENISPDFYTYKEALTTDYVCHFDEGNGISKFFDKLKIPQYSNIEFADVDMTKFNFELLFMPGMKNKPGIFEWNKGSLFFIDKNLNKKELIYAHFQKRDMKIILNSENFEKFIIVPNKFVEYIKIDEEYLNNNTKNKCIYFNYLKKRLKVIHMNIKTGAIKQRIYRMKKRRRLK